MATSVDVRIRELHRHRVANYLGQLRPYSYTDLLLLLAAVHATPRGIAACSLLWFGFLIHLEWQHHDEGRLTWPLAAWAVPWAAAVLIAPAPATGLFLLLAVGYSLKKRVRALAAVSPLANAGLKVALVLLVPGVAASTVWLVFGVMAFRNLMGDVRDAAKDARQGVGTVPVLLGYRRATPLVYPATLMLSTLLWVLVGGLPLWLAVPAWAVEVATYPLTPR